jgi:hypothetical protein
MSAYNCTVVRWNNKLYTVYVFVRGAATKRSVCRVLSVNEICALASEFDETFDKPEADVRSGQIVSALRGES